MQCADLRRVAKWQEMPDQKKQNRQLTILLFLVMQFLTILIFFE